MDDLKTLFPQPVLVPAAGETVEVWPLRARQFAPFAAAVAPLLGAYARIRRDVQGLQWTAEQAGETLDVFAAVERLGADYWGSLIRDHADALIPALAVALNRPEAWVGDLFLDDLVRLALAVFRGNADFFAQRMMPAMVEMMAPTATLGPTPATGSSAPDTAT
jgi:hypothetical protein